MVPSVAELYHARTKYTQEGLARSGKRLDFDHQPSPFKDYVAGTALDLSRYLPEGDVIVSDETLRELRESSSAEERTLSTLAHWLYLSNGVTAVIPYPERPFLMRAAPSAGGLYPTEIYVVAKETSGLPAGLYNYQVRDHSLLRFWETDVWESLRAACFDHPALEQVAYAFVMTGVFYRSAWRYEDRAYRRILLDTGHVIGNMAAYAPWVDQGLFPIGGFVDQRLNELLFLAPEEEAALAVLAPLPAGRSFDGPTALASGRHPSHAIPDSRLLLALHEAGAIAPPVPSPPAPEPGEEAPGYALSFGEPIDASPLHWDAALGETIINRRSTRAYSGEALSREELARLLDFAYRPDLSSEPRVERALRLFAPELLHTYLAVHAVEGLEPGCYRYDPSCRILRQIRFKSLKQEVQYLCLGQEPGGQAGAVVFHTADLPASIARYGDRAYRYLHLDAGHLGERLSLAAVRLGLGSSGIGGFFDDEVNELLGIPAKEAVLYITTIGRPASRG